MTRPTEALRRSQIGSLATKLILFVFVSTFVTALVVSAVSIHASHAQVRRGLEQRYPRALARGAERLGRVLEAGRAELAVLGAGSSLPGDLPRSPRFDGFAWLDAAGDVVRALGSARASEGVGTGDPGLVVLPGEPPRLAARVPCPAMAGDLLGVFRNEVLASALARELPHPAGSLALVDAAGRVVASSAAGAPERVDRVRLREEPGTHTYTNAAGRRVVGASAPLGRGAWRVALEVPFAAAFAPLLAVVTRTFAVDLCIVLVFSLLAYRITLRLIQPIETLSDGARRIFRGDLDVEIPEPPARDEVGLLTRTFNDMMRRLRRQQAEMEAANRGLLSRNEILSQLSITDGLTHLHNHRYFQDHLTREIKRANRTREPLAMLLIDIDDFKKLNDRFGHAAGDELLSGMARIMSSCVRETDLLARYGGEEFVVVAGNTDWEGAYRLAEKIRMNIDGSSFILDDSLRPTRVTISVGVAQFAGNRKRFFDAADRALYRAKAAGKNCVAVDEPGSPETTG
jgi:diguanylate cyclase (GGDEF)-like protein